MQRRKTKNTAFNDITVCRLQPIMFVNPKTQNRKSLGTRGCNLRDGYSRVSLDDKKIAIGYCSEIRIRIEMYEASQTQQRK